MLSLSFSVRVGAHVPQLYSRIDFIRDLYNLILVVVFYLLTCIQILSLLRAAVASGFLLSMSLS